MYIFNFMAESERLFNYPPFVDFLNKMPYT